MISLLFLYKNLLKLLFCSILYAVIHHLAGFQKILVGFKSVDNKSRLKNIFFLKIRRGPIIEVKKSI